MNCKLKSLILIVSLSLFLYNINGYGYNHKVSLIETETTNDSIWIFKSNSIEGIQIESDEIVKSNTAQSTNYHIINFNKSEIILFFQRKGKEEWSKQSFKYYSTKEDNEILVFDTTSNISLNVYLEINPFATIVYSQRDGSVLTFENLKMIPIKEFNKLGLYDWKESNEPIDFSKKIIVSERIKDFEYSEYWRKESFKKSITYIQQKMGQAKPKCQMVRRSPYNPTLVQYIGNQGLRIKLYAEYDCNQDYINQAYFWVDAYYLGKGKWDLELIDQKLTH